MLNWHIANFKTIYHRRCVLCQDTFFSVLTEIINNLRENDPRIQQICNEVLFAGTGHRQYNKDKDVNLAILVHLDAIKEKTYSKIKNGKCRPSIRTIVTICIVLCLDVEAMRRLLALAERSLSNSRLHQAYVYMVEKFSDDQKNVDYCNQFLTALDYGEKHHLGT